MGMVFLQPFSAAARAPWARSPREASSRLAPSGERRREKAFVLPLLYTNGPSQHVPWGRASAWGDPGS